MGKHSFFNRISEEWDQHLKEKDFSSVQKMLAHFSFSPHEKVLDVGAGTGIVYPYLRDLGVSDYQALEPSEGMARVFLKKHPEAKIRVVEFEEDDTPAACFDKIFIFNAFPHFKDFELVFQKSYRALKATGILVICHSMSREELNAYHKKASKVVAEDVLPAQDVMTSLFTNAGFVDVQIENTNWYFASGSKAPFKEEV
ncbi:MAG: hypothetical protein A2X86_21700 [Bdellovibrionales bacterium GWA2_49_15]|nr:MAG: hypothetical protein A2X86_21700 [Bdellovibrionales bacterium GWA2_49_15]HAZ11582.1 hypothetical protein [Bdellovibrionales bacterium]